MSQSADPPERYIAYPTADRALRRLLPNGENVLDFGEGQALLADGTTQQMDNSLDNFEVDVARSLFLWIDNDSVIKIGRVDESGWSIPYFADQCIYVKLERYPFRKLSISPKGSFDVRVYAIASTTPTLPFNFDPVTTHQTRAVTGVNTGDNYASVLTLHMLNFNQKLFRAVNVGSNPIDVRVQRRISGNLSWSTHTENTNIASGNETTIDTQDFAHSWRIQARNNSGGSDSVVDAEAGGVTG